ncbi:DUF1292 domain-containing protein [Natroniella sulfidigena]|uniref:DUF1292 domain-containing protein n=1 Tax=Natroniella sulfidigena TaxID=723921 RepID=UPI00200A64C3|nr:DUF1292 domain-containing protein [Natroniella sulfidigena]MCK8818089.1 DUF1292 domain-containing protein [Natroniella sulfidigena]
MENEGLIKVVDEEEGVVVLEDHDGEQREYEIVTVLDVEDETYLILLHEEDDDTGEGYALKAVEDEAGNKAYQPVVDEDELVKVQQELAATYQ